MKLGSAIKTVRKQLDITQAELSVKTGISQTSLSKIEGGTNPTATNLKKICKALDVPTLVIYLLASDENDVPVSKKQKFRDLFPVIQNVALEIVGQKKKKFL